MILLNLPIHDNIVSLPFGRGDLDLWLERVDQNFLAGRNFVDIFGFGVSLRVDHRHREPVDAICRRGKSKRFLIGGGDGDLLPRSPLVAGGIKHQLLDQGATNRINMNRDANVGLIDGPNIGRGARGQKQVGQRQRSRAHKILPRLAGSSLVCPDCQESPAGQRNW